MVILKTGLTAEWCYCHYLHTHTHKHTHWQHFLSVAEGFSLFNVSSQMSNVGWRSAVTETDGPTVAAVCACLCLCVCAVDYVVWFSRRKQTLMVRVMDRVSVGPGVCGRSDRWSSRSRWPCGTTATNTTWFSYKPQADVFVLSVGLSYKLTEGGKLSHAVVWNVTRKSSAHGQILRRVSPWHSVKII